MSAAMKDTARRAAVATLAGGSIIVLALALWKLRLVLALLFFALIIPSRRFRPWFKLRV
jgi:hypothetical protein